MAELSDFDVATSARFLFNAQNLTTIFFSIGRNSNRRALLEFSALGGFRERSGCLGIRVLLNGHRLGQFTVPRWENHGCIVQQVVLHDFDSDLLRSTGPNILEFRPNYGASNDYCWIGPAAVHFRQNS